MYLHTWASLFPKKNRTHERGLFRITSLVISAHRTIPEFSSIFFFPSSDKSIKSSDRPPRKLTDPLRNIDQFPCNMRRRTRTHTWSSHLFLGYRLTSVNPVTTLHRHRTQVMTHNRLNTSTYLPLRIVMSLREIYK